MEKDDSTQEHEQNSTPRREQRQERNQPKTSQDRRSSFLVRVAGRLLERAKRHQIITFTFIYFAFYNFIAASSARLSGQEIFSGVSGEAAWLLIFLIPTMYFFWWLLVLWILSRLPPDKLKEKLSQHPIATLVFLLLFVIDLKAKAFQENVAMGFAKLNYAFETACYRGFISFIWWLLVCWVSGKIFRNRKHQWRWYLNAVERGVTYVPILFKLVLGLCVAWFVFVVLFSLVSLVLNYSGEDLRALGF